jgi:uracil-DNA glycosylase
MQQMTPPILFIGEAQGEDEAVFGASFVGSSGMELLRMMDTAGIIHFDNHDRHHVSSFYSTRNPAHTNSIWERHADHIRRTNVFQQHPPGNDLNFFCGGKSTAIAGYPALTGSKYIRAEFEPELDRLCAEILALNPNLVVCLGNTPLWALSARTAITKWRGATLLSTHCISDYKLLPTYHPAAVLYQYSLRPTAVADLQKALRESRYPDLRRPSREIWIEPTLEDIAQWFSNYRASYRDRVLATDIETTGSRITCIGFGTSESALVVPFDDERTKSGSYWPTQQAERDCIELIRSVLEDPTIKKVFHNGLYDIPFLWRSVGIKVLGAVHDTMLLMHSLQPESLKSLGYCGSLFADECAWKNLGAHHKTIKRDD